MQPFPRLTAAEAAEFIEYGDLVAFSGFTPSGAAKAVPRALGAGHLRHDLARCCELHRNLELYGSMLPDVSVNQSGRPAVAMGAGCCVGDQPVRSLLD